MKEVDCHVISEVRKFSRFYTNILGLLNKDILDSPYSLTEIRILLEIDRTTDCTANTLIDRLNIDRGYMSRILNRFETNGLIKRVNSSSDARIFNLFLTPEGKEVLSSLEEKSNEQIKGLIDNLTEEQKQKLIDSLQFITSVLSPKQSNCDTDTVNVRTYLPQDIDYIITRHRELYEGEYGFSSEFGDYVEKYVLKFNEHHDETKENLWIAEVDGKPAGMIAMVKVDDTTAQLRWFLVEPEIRGKGLGHKLMKTAVDFCKEKDYKHIFLWTVNILEAARYLYKSYGFKLTESVENNSWTKDTIIEERWDLYL